jgi:hypothetical protein
MPDSSERIARLEIQQENSDSRTGVIETKLDNLAASITRIENKMARMGGFFAGITFAFSVIGAGVAAALDLLYRRFTNT